MHKSIEHRSKKLLSLVSPSRLKSKASRKRIIRDFADRSGLVYFGFVSQLDDEHHLVRGLTLSTKHTDEHYCIGSFQGYDVVFVERSDTVLTSGKSHRWHIIEIDLRSPAEIPHIFIGSSAHGYGFHSLVSTKYPAMRPAMLGALGNRYPQAFLDHFRLLSTPSVAVLAEQIVDPSIAETIGSHFRGLVIEITNQSLYIYSEKTHLSSSLLDAMITNGVWLAKAIDEKSRQ